MFKISKSYLYVNLNKHIEPQTREIIQIIYDTYERSQSSIFRDTPLVLLDAQIKLREFAFTLRRYHLIHI